MKCAGAQGSVAGWGTMIQAEGHAFESQWGHKLHKALGCTQLLRETSTGNNNVYGEKSMTSA
jgi:hypothetical protein